MPLSTQDGVSVTVAGKKPTKVSVPRPAEPAIAIVTVPPEESVSVSVTVPDPELKLTEIFALTYAPPVGMV